MPSVSAHAAIAMPAIVIMMQPERRCAPLKRALAHLVPRLHCNRATRRSSIHIEANGTARIGGNGARLLYSYPFVHPEVFATRELELAILVSHLRAIKTGHQTGADCFMVFEEDAEWSLLLSSPHDALPSLLASMPRHWAVVQAAIIAEMPYLRHLHRRLSQPSASRASSSHREHATGPSTAHGGVTPPPPVVPRHSLRGLSWPLTPGREVVANRTWVHPYWSAPRHRASEIACPMADF